MVTPSATRAVASSAAVRKRATAPAERVRKLGYRGVVLKLRSVHGLRYVATVLRTAEPASRWSTDVWLVLASKVAPIVLSLTAMAERLIVSDSVCVATGGQKRWLL